MPENKSLGHRRWLLVVDRFPARRRVVEGRAGKGFSAGRGAVNLNKYDLTENIKNAIQLKLICEMNT